MIKGFSTEKPAHSVHRTLSLFVSFCLMKTATEAKKVKRDVAVFPVL
jgi:hypothetical protein